MPDILVQCTDLHYAYKDAGKPRQVLKGIKLRIARGESIALLGASGAGKSTLLNLLGGIDRPESGDVIIDRQSLRRMAEPELTLFRRSRIGFIYQLFNLIPTLTVAENIGLPLELAGVNRSRRREYTDLWLQRVGLAGRDAAFPDQLSGGEQQRVAIARALVHRPALVLADEPTGNLDANTGRRILDLLFQLASDDQQTLFIVTHSEAVAARAERLLQLHSGRVSELTAAGQ